MPSEILWIHLIMSFAAVTVRHIACCLRVNQPVTDVLFGSLVYMPPSLTDVPVTKERLTHRQNASLREGACRKGFSLLLGLEL